jgi:hypothetical protein
LPEPFIVTSRVNFGEGQEFALFSLRVTVHKFAFDHLPRSDFACDGHILRTDSGPHFSTGFAQANGLSLNNGAAINGSRLRLTDGGNYEARSVFATTPVQLQSFTNDFSFQLTNANADGFTFTIATSPSALGSNGGGLGYGGINNSVAVKFDLYNNSGEGNNSTQDPFRD